MLTDRGSAIDLDDVDPSWLEDVAAIHLPAYSLVAEPISGACRLLAAAVRTRGGMLSMDASSVAELERFGPVRFLDLVGSLEPDVLFANADEATRLGLRDAPPRGAAAAVVKAGPDPVTLLQHDHPPELVDVEPLELKDTTGAGDALAGGWLAAWFEGASGHEACAAGIATARRALELLT
jgi:sugar/nucleoside kinase (ribokinase family)